MQKLLLLILCSVLTVSSMAAGPHEEALKMATEAANKYRVPVQSITPLSNVNLNNNTLTRFLVTMQSGATFEVYAPTRVNNIDTPTGALSEVITGKIFQQSFSLLSAGTLAPDSKTVFKEVATTLEARLKVMAALKADLKSGVAPKGTYLKQVTALHEAQLRTQLTRLKTVTFPSQTQGQNQVVTVAPESNTVFDLATLEELAKKLRAAQVFAEQDAQRRTVAFGTEPIEVQLAQMEASVQKMPPGPGLIDTLKDSQVRIRAMIWQIIAESGPNAQALEMQLLEQQETNLRAVQKVAALLLEVVPQIKTGQQYEMALKNAVALGGQMAKIGEAGIKLPRLAQLISVHVTLIEYAQEFSKTNSPGGLYELDKKIQMVEFGLYDMSNRLKMEIEALKATEKAGVQGVSPEMAKLELDLKCVQENIKVANELGRAVNKASRVK